MKCQNCDFPLDPTLAICPNCGQAITQKKSMTRCYRCGRVVARWWKLCPQCGAEVELFSIDKRVACDGCGFVVYNSLQSCVQWCAYAEQCVGAEVVSQFRK